MMNVDQALEQSIGFTDIRSKLIAGCYTPAGSMLARMNFFTSNANEIARSAGLTSEMKSILEFRGGIPALAHDDFIEELRNLRIEGTPASVELLIVLLFVLEKTKELRTLFLSEPETTPLLAALAADESVETSLPPKIMAVLDEKGEIRNSASDRLADLRQSMISHRRKTEKMIAAMLRELKDRGVVDDDVSLGLRSGRLVIPVPAARKKMIRGVVLDESATGQTVYVEPIEIFELNNELQDLEYEEKREIHRILTLLADQVRPEIPLVEKNIAFIGKVDFIRSKATLAVSQNAIQAGMAPQAEMVLMQARHPLLEESLVKQNRTIVPLDIELLSSQRMMIISGPNAGGKSVAMKTAGLIQYMFQCGFLVPAAEGSRLFPFDRILTDIGDQQSIENDLSTYSSHLINLRTFIEKGDEKTLVLIDEFGSGTEPESGGAIAEAVLSILHRKGVFAIITTHYFNLKMFASSHPGVVNAAMLYDNTLLKPLFRLAVGKPGSSFALEIARSTGLPDEVLTLAAGALGRGKIDMEKMVQDLEKEKVLLDDRRRQLEIAEGFVSELIEKYEKLNRSIQEKRSALLRKAEAEAAGILGDANALIEKTIRDIRQEQAEKEKVRKIRKDFEQKSSELIQPRVKVLDPLPLKKSTQHPPKKMPAVGDRVRLDGGPELGEVLSIQHQKARVLFGLGEVSVSVDRLTVVAPTNQPKPAAGKKVKLIAEKKDQPFSLDLRGMRGEEAIRELELFLDQAMLNGLRSFSILHGKGYGILRTIIRKHLAGYKEYLECSDAIAEAGGDGVTEVRFL